MKYFNHVRHVKVVLTHKCNLACSYCIDEPSKEDLGAFKYTDELIGWAKELPNLYSVLLFGGEPLVASNVYDIGNTILNELPTAKLGFFTNGTIMTPKFEEFLNNERTVVFLTRTSFKDTHDTHRVYKGSNIGTYDTITANLEKVYATIGNRLTLANTIMADDIDRAAQGIINDFNFTDNVKVNLHRELDGSMKVDFGKLELMFKDIIDYVVENPTKCIVNLSTFAPINKQALQRDYRRFMQGTLAFDHLNGVKNILVNVDGTIYPSFPNDEKSNAMGTIFGEIFPTYEKYSEDKKGTLCETCEYKFSCSPCYSITDKSKTVSESYCNYTKACLNSMNYYFEKCKEKGLL